ncbi:MAG: DUF2778 domain-containing protein [Afipia sp.]|nr:DUF2778 domain-containing protein [Afipia sp.]
MAYSITYRVPDARPAQAQPRKISPQAAIGSTGLAVVVLACAWTLYSNVLGPAVQAMAPELPQVTFIPGAKAALSTTVADLDVTSSLGTPSQSFTPLNFNQRFVIRSDDPPVSGSTLTEADREQVAPQQTYAVASLAPEALPAPAETAPAPVVEATPAPEIKPAEATLPLPEVRQASLAIPLPAPRPASLRANDGPSRSETASANRAAALAAVAQPKLTIFEKLFGRQEKGPLLAFAAPDGGIASDGSSLTPGRYDKQTAVYDITARTVYLPDGTKLEAHSGLGSKLDDPRFVHVRMHGATPPHTYDLTLRESLFHGVEAIRLNPVGGERNVFGRTGLLAHTYMLGPNGDSNGCVSFRDYDRFLRAFKRGDIKRLVVVAKLD